jgi:FixJ family two-component response regulator
LVTAEGLRNAHKAAAQAKRSNTISERQRFLTEDVLLLRKRGLVPLAIADELGISLRRVVDYLEEAGEEIPGYLTTWSEPPREPKPCAHCGADRA